MAHLNLFQKTVQQGRSRLLRISTLVMLFFALASCVQTHKPIISEKDRTNIGDQLSLWNADDRSDEVGFRRTITNLYMGSTGQELISFRDIKNEGRSKLLLSEVQKSNYFETSFLRVMDDGTMKRGDFVCSAQTADFAARYGLKYECIKGVALIKPVTVDFDPIDMDCFLLEVVNHAGLQWAGGRHLEGIKLGENPNELRCEQKSPQGTSSTAEHPTLGRRVALVIGNSSYKYMPTLNNPRNDALDVDAALKALGFDTVMAVDLDKAGMNDALNRFSKIARGAQLAIVYYAGHGMQFAGKNYLLPIDANLVSASDVNRFELLPVDDLTDVLALANGMQLIVLDACRNNPVERDFKNKLASAPGGYRDGAQVRGFSRIEARSGLIVMFATGSNDVASDGDGRNSPFTSEFLRSVGKPNQEVRQMLYHVQSDVYQRTDRRQLPEITSQYVGPDVMLRPAASR